MSASSLHIQAPAYTSHMKHMLAHTCYIHTRRWEDIVSISWHSWLCSETKQDRNKVDDRGMGKERSPHPRVWLKSLTS